MRALGLLITSVLLLALATPAPPAAAQRPPLPTILQDDALLLHRPATEVDAALARMRELGVDVVRITAGWSVLTRAPDAPLAPPFEQADPAAYEPERWAALDRAVRLADRHGLRVMLDVGFWAPRWAAADAGPRARTHVDPDAFARFATAVARRYDGRFTPALPSGPRPGGEDLTFLEALFGGVAGRGETRSPEGPLPRVDLLTLWNEPNHPAFLQPQWRRGAPASATAYRRMVAAAHPAVKAVRPEVTVLVGGTSAHGTGGRGVPPLRFLRALACVDADLRPVRRGSCARFARVPGDGWAHHPYVLGRPPDTDAPADRPDDVPLAAVGRLAETLRALVARGRLAPGLADVWITEFGYETSPPAARGLVSTGDQARFLPWAEHLAWREPAVRSFAQFLLRDLPPAATRQSASARRGFGQWESGLEFSDGRPKLAALAFRAALFAQRRPDGRVDLWARSRGDTVAMEVQRRGRDRRWRAVRLRGPRRVAAVRSVVLVARAAVPPGSRLRLRVRDARGAWRAGPSVAPVAAPAD